VLFLSVNSPPDLAAAAQIGVAVEIPRQRSGIANIRKACATLLGSARVGTELAKSIPSDCRPLLAFGEKFLPPACHRRFTVAA
jgi:hypothetical protein